MRRGRGGRKRKELMNLKPVLPQLIDLTWKQEKKDRCRGRAEAESSFGVTWREIEGRLLMVGPGGNDKRPRDSSPHLRCSAATGRLGYYKPKLITC